jgi:hypothetical protein
MIQPIRAKPSPYQPLSFKILPNITVQIPTIAAESKLKSEKEASLKRLSSSKVQAIDVKPSTNIVEAVMIIPHLFH